MQSSDNVLYLAEIGSKRHMLQISAAINAVDYLPDRIEIAYKWAFLSALLGFDEAKHTVDYLRRAMTDTQINAADQLVDAWLDRKFRDFTKHGRQEFTDELIEVLCERNN